MQAEMEKLAETSKDMMGSLKQLSEINFSIFASLGQQQMDLVGIYMEAGTKQLQAAGDVKDLASVVSAQTQLAEDFSKKMINNTSVTVDILTDAKTQLSGWGEKWMDLVTSSAQASK